MDSNCPCLIVGLQLSLEFFRGLGLLLLLPDHFVDLLHLLLGGLPQQEDPRDLQDGEDPGQEQEEAGDSVQQVVVLEVPANRDGNWSEKTSDNENYKIDVSHY